MIGTLIGLVLLLVVAGVIWWGAQTLIALVPMPPAFQTVIHVLMVLIIVIVVLYILLQLLGLAGIHVNMPRLG